MVTLIPDLLYRDDAFYTGLALEYDERTGMITRIAHSMEMESHNSLRLPGRALMPGFVNTHSHAFQRLIRGRTQWRPADDSVSDFWSWREAMYRAVLALSPEDVYVASRFCFLEMLRAGITTVGEFHYLHNDPTGRAYADSNELAQSVVDAARDVGIRICLLNVCYATGGIGQPLRSEQRRFATPDLDAFLATTEALAAGFIGDPLVSVGVAPHSVRAVPREWIRILHAWATTRDLPFHMHVSEQAAEVDACIEAYGVRPIEMLHEDSVLDSRFTGVHATHISDAEVQSLARSGATVCACPSTERDLGDGFLRAVDLVREGGQIALGTDSQTVIDMLEEMRLVEYHERLRRRDRVAVTRGTGDGEPLEPAPLLLQMATQAGARSLRLNAGALEPGAVADLIGIDLGHHSLAGWTAGTLPSMIALSAPSDVVSDVWVCGRAVVADRRHYVQEEAMRSFNVLARQPARS
jgi:formimidoylglutamate deiminase